jgi:dolichyl-phosphate-mannose--protein O-mannosyl transferase
VSYGEVLEDKYISVTVLYVAVCFVMWLYYYVILFSLLCYVFFVSLSILIVMYVPFCVIVLFCVPFVCECVLDNCHRNIAAIFDYPN